MLILLFFCLSYAFLISKTLYFATPPGVFASTVSPFFAPINAAPIGDTFEILFFDKSTSVEPTIVYSSSSLNSMSKIFTVFPT